MEARGCLFGMLFREQGVIMEDLPLRACVRACSTLLCPACNCRSSLTVTYRCRENIKKRSYEQRIREVEHGSFTPLVFSASGGMAPAATITFERLASLIAEKQQQDYNKTIAWIRCLLSFSLVRSSVMCLRGARHVHRTLPLIIIIIFYTCTRNIAWNKATIIQK